MIVEAFDFPDRVGGARAAAGGDADQPGRRQLRIKAVGDIMLGTDFPERPPARRTTASAQLARGEATCCKRCRPHDRQPRRCARRSACRRSKVCKDMPVACYLFRTPTRFAETLKPTPASTSWSRWPTTIRATSARRAAIRARKRLREAWIGQSGRDRSAKRDLRATSWTFGKAGTQHRATSPSRRTRATHSAARHRPAAVEKVEEARRRARPRDRVLPRRRRRRGPHPRGRRAWRSSSGEAARRPHSRSATR